MTRIGARNLWFQVHKWIGLILCIVVIPLSLTGSLLVWHDALDRALHANRYPGSGAATAPVSRYIAAARPLLPPGGRVVGVALPEEADGAVVVRLTPEALPEGRRAARGRPRMLAVYIDPRSAAVLDSEWSDRGVMRFLHVFHGSLLIPGLGRTIVGWLGVLMLVSSLTGLWIWWPTIGRWTRGLRWRRGSTFDLNLHHLVGFWIALPLAVLSLTGAWISFPALFAGVVGERAPGRPGGFGGGGGGAPAEDVRLTPDAVAALLAREGRLLQIGMPSGDPAMWSGTVIGADGRQQRLQVDDEAGEVVPARAQPRGRIAGLMRTLHDGGGTGPVWRTIIFLAGIAPAALGITGVTMWLRSRRWRGKAATAKARRTQAA